MICIASRASASDDNNALGNNNGSMSYGFNNCAGRDCSDRLSDAFSGRVKASHNTTDIECKSILCDYHRLVTKKHTGYKNLSALHEIVMRHRVMFNFSVPRYDDMVVHFVLATLLAGLLVVCLT